MGTRGALILVCDGRELVHYVQFDAYPDGLGAKTALEVERQRGSPLEELARASEDDPLAAFKEAVRALVARPENETPGGAGRRNWYDLLRRDQGSLTSILARGEIAVKHRSWTYQSLFCEWGYVVDLDEAVFEVYQGFNESPAVGRFEEGNAEQLREPPYYPITRIASFSLFDPGLSRKVSQVDRGEE